MQKTLITDDGEILYEGGGKKKKPRWQKLVFYRLIQMVLLYLLGPYLPWAHTNVEENPEILQIYLWSPQMWLSWIIMAYNYHFNGF